MCKEALKIRSIGRKSKRFGVFATQHGTSGIASRSIEGHSPNNFLYLKYKPNFYGSPFLMFCSSGIERYDLMASLSVFSNSQKKEARVKFDSFVSSRVEIPFCRSFAPLDLRRGVMLIN